MSKSQRTKGAGGERELCGILSDALGQVVKRKLGQARDSGNDIDIAPFRIECKRRKHIGNLYEWLKQAEGDIDNPARVDGLWYDGTTGRWYRRIATPVVALRADGNEWLVVMRLSDWIELAREEIAK